MSTSVEHPRSHSLRNRIWLVAVLLTISGYVGWRIANARAGRGFADEIGHANALALYEGLPHQMFERLALELEQKTKPTVRFHDYPFYADPILPAPEDAKALRDLLGRHATFEPFAGEKRCGGFHPDWAVEFTANSRRHIALLCFGCGEAKVNTLGGTSRYDLEDGAKKQLEDLLSRYRKNRPKREERE